MLQFPCNSKNVINGEKIVVGVNFPILRASLYFRPQPKQKPNPIAQYLKQGFHVFFLSLHSYIVPSSIFQTSPSPSLLPPSLSVVSLIPRPHSLAGISTVLLLSHGTLNLYATQQYIFLHPQPEATQHQQQQKAATLPEDDEEDSLAKVLVTN